MYADNLSIFSDLWLMMRINKSTQNLKDEENENKWTVNKIVTQLEGPLTSTQKLEKFTVPYEHKVTNNTFQGRSLSTHIHVYHK